MLELAAGPGEVGFLALPRLLPGGELISTDVAPEMVEAARRRAEELGLEGVRFAVEDAARALASATTRSTPSSAASGSCSSPRWSGPPRRWHA